MNITANTAAFYRGMKRAAAHFLRMRKRRVRPTRLRLRLRVNAGRYERQMRKAVAADDQVAGLERALRESTSDSFESERW